MSEFAQVLLVGTDFPPQVCGIGDFSALLAQRVTDAGTMVEIRRERFSTLRASLACLRHVSRRHIRLIHFHYPNIGWKGKLAPFLLPLYFPGRSVMVTVHEFKRSSRIGRFLGVTWSLFCSRIVFTNREDMKLYLQRFPWARRKTVRIAISSNIAAREPDYGAQQRLILYFGLVYPGKGLEDFLELARLAGKAELGYRFRVVGGVPESAAGYAAELRAGAPGGVTWAADLPASEVSAELIAARYVYLPYETGASERNGSLLAALAHGAPVMTTPGDDPYPGFADAMFLVSGPRDALDTVSRCDANEASRVEKGRSGRRFFQDNFSWETVSSEYVRLYTELLG